MQISENVVSQGIGTSGIILLVKLACLGTEDILNKLPQNPGYKSTQLWAHLFWWQNTILQLYPLLDISMLQLLYSNYLYEATINWLQ